MDIDSLKEFSVLAVVRSFSEASKQLCVSQPTLSRHVDALEKELRCKLFERTVPLTLTPAGKAMLIFVNDIVQAHEGMLQTARDMRDLQRRAIRMQDISISEAANAAISYCEYVVEKRHPECEFIHQPTISGKSTDELIFEGRLDIGFAHGFGVPGDEIAPVFNQGIKLVKIPSLGGQLVFKVRKDNPIASKQQLKLSDCSTLGFMTPTESRYDVFREAFSDFCEKYGGFRPRFDFREIDVHINFYSKDPGRSAFIYRKSDLQRTSMFPSWFEEESAELLFPEFCIFTYAVIREDAEDEAALEFIDELESYASV